MGHGQGGESDETWRDILELCRLSENEGAGGGRTRGKKREQVCEGWRFFSKLWKDGSVEAGKRKRNEDITAIGKKCVCECLLYCGGPTYPSILLRRLSPQEEGWSPLPRPRTHTHTLSLSLAASYTHSARGGSSR